MCWYSDPEAFFFFFFFLAMTVSGTLKQFIESDAS